MGFWRGDLWPAINQCCMIMGSVIQQFANNFPKAAKMNIYSAENCFNPYSPFFPHFSSFFYLPSLPQSAEDSLKKPNLSKIRQVCQYKMLEQVESPSFETRYEPSIIIQSNTELSHPETTKTTPKKKKLTKPLQKKITQKESRNVASNLLRIFLKHTLQLRFYDRLIQKMINSRAMRCTVEEFRTWLLSFGINYKNYIRFTEVKRLFGEGEQQQMKAICRMLLRQYCQGVGAEHCLTSRRIEKEAVSMHLLGLRELVQQLMPK